MSQLKAPMVGQIIEILVNVGDEVAVDDEVLVIESMKMQIPVQATAAGRVAAIRVAVGDSVEEDQVLLELEP